MKIKKISFVIGTRPQIIKSQPLINQLIVNRFNVDVVYTGQHYDYELSKKFFKDLKIVKPTVNLDIGSGTQLAQISKIIRKLENYFQKIKPELVIVPGDTTSALGASLASSKCGIKIAHLEAGARSNQFYMSEEVNRRIIDHSSNILFAPTRNCLKNLMNESTYGKAYFVGDTMYDLFLKLKKKLLSNSSIKKSRKSILITIHRAENIEDKKRLKNIVKLIHELSRQDYEIIFPIHPHTQRKFNEFNFKVDFIKKPFGYSELLKNLFRCSLVITDSGGLQKEAYWMERPCVTLRENTEWIETVNEKANFLFSPNKQIPIDKIEKICKIKFNARRSLFGNGKASEKISRIIRNL